MDRFDRWVLDNAKALNLKIDQLSWVQEYFPGETDISVEFELAGYRFDGRGNATSKPLALRKALAECFERAVCLKVLPSTNGVAAHTDLELAQKNALNELLERDSFLSHFYTKTPFQLVETFKIPDTIERLIGQHGAVVRVYKMKPTNLGQGVVALISNQKDWGAVLGLSFGEDFEASAYKALFEAFRQFFDLQFRDELLSNLTLETFLTQKEWSFNHHKLLCLNTSYFQSISYLFPEEVKELSDVVNYDKSKFDFEQLKSQDHLMSGMPLSIVQCLEPSSQNLVPGPTDMARINHEGLQRFMNGKPYTLNLLPQPFN